MDEGMAAMAELAEMAAEIPWPDGAAEQAVRDRISRLAVPAEGLGRFAELAEWLAGAQGVAPPRELRRPRLLVFAEDDDAGPGAIVAPLADISLRCVAVPRRTTFADAVDFGVDLADQEVDSGADLLMLAERGSTTWIQALTVISVLADVEPVRVVGRRDRIDDAQWSRDVVAVRDARRQGAALKAEPGQLLAAVGGLTLTAMAAFLLRAAGRATPVLLDGTAATAAALAARELAPRTIRWWQASHRSTDPAHVVALDRLRLDPILELGTLLDGGVGAALAVPLLQAAVQLYAHLPESPAADRPAEQSGTAPPQQGEEVGDVAATETADWTGRSASADVGDDEGWLAELRSDSPSPDVEDDV
jgi:nicotinate-nucleotide--dimethylbenzimidazole phosphoribosyltransferase